MARWGKPRIGWATQELLSAAGLRHPSELGPEHILRRVTPSEVRSLATLYRFLEPGELLRDAGSTHAVFRDYWQQARSDSFAPPERLATLRGCKSH